MARTIFFNRSRMNSTRARQGALGRGVFWVLVVSTALAFAGLIAAWLWYAPSLATGSPGPQDRLEEAQQFQAPAPQARQTPADPPMR